jgi:surface protein
VSGHTVQQVSPLLQKLGATQIVSKLSSFLPMPLTPTLALLLLALPAKGQLALTDTSIRTAVTAWDTNSTAAAKTYGSIGVWNTAAVGNMAELFESSSASKSKFNADISKWNVARVSIMDYMFTDAQAFNADLSGWNVASVTTMIGMFDSANAFDSDLSGWNVARVKRLASMFKSAEAFDRNIAGWNVLSVTLLFGALLHLRPHELTCC